MCDGNVAAFVPDLSLHPTAGVAALIPAVVPQVEAQRAREKARLAAIPGMVAPADLPDAMADA